MGDGKLSRAVPCAGAGGARPPAQGVSGPIYTGRPVFTFTGIEIGTRDILQRDREAPLTAMPRAIVPADPRRARCGGRMRMPGAIGPLPFPGKGEGHPPMAAYCALTFLQDNCLVAGCRNALPAARAPAGGTPAGPAALRRLHFSPRRGYQAVDKQASGRKARRGLMGKAEQSRRGGMVVSIFPKAAIPPSAGHFGLRRSLSTAFYAPGGLFARTFTGEAL